MNYLGAKVVKTRKPHDCWGCANEYPAGNKMTAVTIADDRIATFYWCEECQLILDSLPMWERGQEWDEGQLKAIYSEPLTKEQRIARENYR